MTQLRLPKVEPPRTVRPAADRTTPALWVRRIVVVRELALGDAAVVRNVVLRRGLNIIWTPPRPTGGANQLFQSGMSGHTAGKTTFCRLIRYALGEHGLSTERTRRRIREKFPTGWLLAEAQVDGDDWAVARPFAIGAHSFCKRVGAIENLVADGDERLDYNTFLEAIARASVETLPSRTLPTTDQPVRWEHLLPWLSRDQECRFTDFVEWRHGSSDSDAPGLSVDERQFIVRSVLGLISDAERTAQLRNTRLVAERKEASRRAPLLEHQASVDHQRLADILPAATGPTSAALFAASARSALRARREAVEQQLAELRASAEIGALRQAHERAIEQETNAKRDVDDAELRLKAEQGALAALSAPNTPALLLATLPPERGYCNQPMSLARDRSCPLASTQPTELAAKRSERVAVDERARLQALVEALEGTVAEKKRVVGERVAERAAAGKAEMVARTRLEERRAPLDEERLRLEHQEQRLEEADRAEVAARGERDRVETLTREIEASYATQEQLRAESGSRLGHLASTFDYVVRALLGDEVTASVTAAGRSLALSIESNGDRESAAIETVKLLAFDLAALTESVQGRGFFPRFLLHDGPREADLSPDIYERLFLYLRKLEACFTGEPSFQYIVTTTTQPPEELLTDPWRRLTLAGIPAEERLLRCDL